MKTTYYFSHDFNTRTDKKIKLLLKRFGWYGYGLFWAIVEDLYNNANALPLDYDSIAFDLRTDDIKMLESIINDFELFENDGQIFWSNSVQRRLDEREERSVKARESANKRWENANAMRTQSKGNAIKERKGKEIKGNEINENNNDVSNNEVLKNSNLFRKPNIPTYEQVHEFFLKNGGTEKMALNFFNKHEGAGWFVNGSPITNFVYLANNFIVNWNTNLKTKTNATKSRSQRQADSMRFLLEKGREEYAKVMAINSQNKKD